MSDCKCCKAVPGTGGEKYIPMEERTGEEKHPLRYLSDLVKIVHKTTAIL